MKKIVTNFCFLLIPLFSISQNISLLGHKTYPNGVSCSNLTGYAAGGKEYALVGTSLGLSIVDITNPTTPTEIFAIPGAQGQGGFWREVREYNGYAYVTTEQTSGLLVVNLNDLPNSAPYHTINPGGMQTSHTIFIASDGYAYINGTDLGLEGSTVVLNLNTNGWNPPMVGQFQSNYVHDCFERNDTLWNACINDGFIKVVNTTDKTQLDAPANTMAVWNTPQNFAHNCWPSDDGKYLFTTDEKPSSWLTCYDVTDLSNVTEVSRVQAEPGDSTIIHNTYFLNDYCITSYYTYGVTIHDVTRKNNMIETGHYDTSPNFQGDGFNGCWGVWPYLPSGNIIASDIETGLWILAPTYTRASYLEGIVSDTSCNIPLTGVTVTIQGTNGTTLSNLTGQYATGTAAPGSYTVTYSKPGYQSLTLNNVVLTTGNVTTQNVVLQPSNITSVNFRVTANGSISPIPNAKIVLKDNNGVIQYEGVTNSNGEYRICNLNQGVYDVYWGKWGFRTEYSNYNLTGSIGNLDVSLSNGYYDDFVLDFGWSSSQTSTAGWWERGAPNGTNYNGDIVNPNNDITNDIGVECFVTGNAGGQAGEDDVDDGISVLVSPVMNLSGMIEPYVQFYSWFFNGGGNGGAPNDSLVVKITNGTDTVVLKRITATTGNMSDWLFNQFSLNGVISLTSNMRVIFECSDVPQGHLLEAAIDKFEAYDSAGVTVNEIDKTQLLVFPNPSKETFFVSNSYNQEIPYRIIDLQGRIQEEGILERQITETAKNLYSGMYQLFILENGNWKNGGKLVKVTE